MTQQFHSWVYIFFKKETLIQKVTFMFIAILITIAKIWKHSNIHNRILLSNKKE